MNFYKSRLVVRYFKILISSKQNKKNPDSSISQLLYFSFRLKNHTFCMMQSNTPSRFAITKLHGHNFHSCTRYSFGYFEVFKPFHSITHPYMKYSVYNSTFNFKLLLSPHKQPLPNQYSFLLA